MTTGPASGARVVCGIEDRPSLRDALPLGLQHVLTMPLIIAGAIGMATGDTAMVLDLLFPETE